MVTLDTLKPGDTWACPLCHRSATMYTEGTMRGSLRAHKADGVACDGAGFGPFRRAFPQEVRIFGRDKAINQVRIVHGKPDWEPPVYGPGDLQNLMREVWPQADSFRIVGLVGPRDRSGVVFAHGARKWRYATSDVHISPLYTSSVEAMDGFCERFTEEN